MLRTRSAESAFADIAALDNTLPQYVGLGLGKNDLEKVGTFIPQKHYKFPYPQTALDRNVSLIQKPEWAGEE